jgi:hypothetical protein
VDTAVKPPPTRPKIGTSFLLPQDRIARSPLGPWAAALRRQLRRCLEQSRTTAAVSDEVGSAGNNAALIAAHRGAGALARRLCERQLCWQARLSRRSRNPGLATGCVQPWVNLARLDSLAGKWESAFARLSALQVCGTHGVLSLRPLQPDGIGCLQVRAEGGFAQSLETVYVIDSLRVLLQNGRCGEVVEFAARMATEPCTHLQLWADEALVVSACQRGDVESADQAAQAALARPQTVGWSRAVFRLRRAEVLACAGETQRAAEILESMAGVMDRLSEPVLRNLQTLYVLMPLASACWAAGLEGQAGSLARAVYHGAKAAADEAFQIDALRLLVAAAPAEEREASREALERLETATEYQRYRHLGSTSAVSGEFELLNAELESVFES